MGIFNRRQTEAAWDQQTRERLPEKVIHTRCSRCLATWYKAGSRLSEWLAKLASRTHHNVVAVALANKLARIAWAVLAKEERSRPPALISLEAA